MSDSEQRTASVEILQRMVTYIREEALRLRVMDVAILLEHAEEALTAFAPASLTGHDLAPTVLDRNRVEH